MPRSKNPNPRQVTEEEERNATSESDPSVTPIVSGNDNCEPLPLDTFEENDIMKIELGGNESPVSEERASPLLENIAAKRDSLAKLTAKKFASIYNASDDSENERMQTESPCSELDAPVVDGCLPLDYTQEDAPEARTSLNFSPSSPPSFFVMGTKSRPPPPLRRMVQTNGDGDAMISGKAKAKPSSPSGMLNPEIMRWMRKRFEMRDGGKMSASDIIQVYNYDMKDLPVPPPSLQNYQVGQLLRRIFPTIQRCKITVNGKRVWVYRHLSLIDPPPNLEDDSEPENGIGDELLIDERMYDSPQSVPEPEMEDQDVGGNGSHPGSVGDESEAPLQEEINGKVIKKEKSNTILLGLLGQRTSFKSLSPSNGHATHIKQEKSPVVEKNGVNGDEPLNQAPMKKKRDSEVVDWLLTNYKFKTGYYVKSMDLLRRYNDGREELVKYLSQVGRVMKHVFPGVRHLRKSFKGGKREWVYLNLKPIDVDSDSEEGLKMMMPSLRRVSNFRVENNSPQNQNKPNNEFSNWKRERVDISHMPLVSSQDAIFKPKANVYHSVSRLDGNKLIISRNDKISEQSQENIPHLQDPSERSVNRTRIVLYNKQRDSDSKCSGQNSEDCRAPSDLERDIFAPFSKSGQKNNHTSPHVKSLQRQTQFFLTGMKSDDLPGSSENSADWIGSGVFLKQVSGGKTLSSDNELDTSKDDDTHWASKRLKMCVTETTINGDMDEKEACNTGLDLSVKSDKAVGLPLDEPTSGEAEQSTVLSAVTRKESSDGNEEPCSEEVLNLTKKSEKDSSEIKPVEQKVILSPAKMQTIHYKPINNRISLPVKIANVTIPNPDYVNGRLTTKVKTEPDSSGGITVKYVNAKNFEPGQKRKFCVVSRKSQEGQISWESLQNFNGQRYGWLRSPHTSWTTSRTGENGEKKVLRFVEWFLFSGQWLVDRQRALREIKIYDDWTVVIHALGRRVYPNDLGGITDLEKTTDSLNKVFRVLAEAKLCMGFPAPCVSDLYIHGILVSKFEVWSSREDTGEDIRQRAVNCQILYSSAGSCCNKCARIMRLHQQQKRGAAFMKRPGAQQQSIPK